MTDDSSALEREYGSWDAVRELDPGFFERYEALASQSMEAGPLDAKTVELVALAVHAACTTRHEPGIREHVGAALDAGAPVAEILDVLEMVSSLGVHAVTEGVPIVADVAGAPEPEDEAERERIDALRQRFEEERGYWDEMWEQVVQLDADYFERYLEYSAYSWETGPLSPKVREFVIIAMDASTTHLYLPGLRVHVENAVSYGATREELMAVLEIASLLGMTTMSETAPILLEEARKRGKLPSQEG